MGLADLLLENSNKKTKEFFPEILNYSQQLRDKQLREEFMSTQKEVLSALSESTDLADLLTMKIKEKAQNKIIIKEGTPGAPGQDGVDGRDGKDGLSGREIELHRENSLVSWRYKGSEEEWNPLIDLKPMTEEIASLKSELSEIQEKQEEEKYTAPKMPYPYGGGGSINYERVAQVLEDRFGFNSGSGGVSGDFFFDEVTNSLFTKNPTNEKWYGPQKTIHFTAESTDGSFLPVQGFESGLIGYTMEADYELQSIRFSSDGGTKTNELVKEFTIRSQGTIFKQFTSAGVGGNRAEYSEDGIGVLIPAESYLQISSSQTSSPAKKVSVDLVLIRVKSSTN